MRLLGGITATVIVVFAVVYGSFALYEGSWSLASHNAQHSLEIQKQITNGQGQIAEGSFSFQSALGERIVTGIQSVNTDSTEIISASQQGDTTYANQLKSQREYDAGQVCYLATQVNGSLPAANVDTKWINTNCSEGNLNPSSTYYYMGN
jgi:hypothetical protein